MKRKRQRRIKGETSHRLFKKEAEGTPSRIMTIRFENICFFGIAFLVAACNADCRERPNETGEIDSVAVAMAESCLSTGERKENLYAIVYSVGASDNFQIAIADTTRMKELHSAWMPYVCNKLPGSLKKESLELLVNIVDNTMITEAGERRSTVSIQGVKLLNEYLGDDPRNGPGVGSVHVLMSPFEGTPGGYIIKTTEDQEHFSRTTEATIATPIDFDEVTLLGYKTMIGGCWPGGNFTYRNFARTDDGKYKLTVETKSYGACQVAYIKWHWVVVPKVDAGEEVEFDFRETNFHNI